MAGVINIGADNASDQFYRYKMPKLQARVWHCSCYYEDLPHPVPCMGRCSLYDPFNSLGSLSKSSSSKTVFHGHKLEG
jgi:hypothetical protein